MTTEESCRNTTPFLKWAGGKRWISKDIATILKNDKGNYIEPFLGGGSIFFEVKCRAALLADLNDDLINVFRVVRDKPYELVKILRCLEVKKSLFKRIRREECKDPIARAARFLYLNKTAFNGLYRVNRHGDFNVPYGCKPGTRLFDLKIIEMCSEKLQNTVLMPCDFRTTLAFAKPNDTIFIDPPYTVKHNNNGFRHYNESLFSWDDQILLSHFTNQLAASGARIVVTNAFHPEVMALYDKKHFAQFAVTRPTAIAANAKSRGRCTELVLLSRAALEFRDNDS